MIGLDSWVLGLLKFIKFSWFNFNSWPVRFYINDLVNASGDDFVDWIHIFYKKTHEKIISMLAHVPVVLKMRNQTINYYRWNVVYLRLDHITRCISPMIIGKSDDLFDLCLGLRMCTYVQCPMEWSILRSKQVVTTPVFNVYFRQFEFDVADRSIHFIPVEMISMQKQSILTTVLFRE